MLWRLFTVNVDPMSTNDHFGRPLYWWQVKVVVLVGGCVAKLEEATQQFKRNIFDFIPNSKTLTLLYPQKIASSNRMSGMYLSSSSCSHQKPKNQHCSASRLLVNDNRINHHDNQSGSSWSGSRRHRSSNTLGTKRLTWR